MTPQERKELDDRMVVIRHELDKFLAQLPISGWEAVVYREPEKWTVADTVRHLIQAEKSMVRLMEGIRQGHPGTPVGFDLGAFNRRGIDKIADQSRDELLQNLTSVRQKTVAFMDSLSEKEWDLRGRHAIGKVLSLAEICNVIADHENGHLADMKRAREAAEEPAA